MFQPGFQLRERPDPRDQVTAQELVHGPLANIRFLRDARTRNLRFDEIGPELGHRWHELGHATTLPQYSADTQEGSQYSVHSQIENGSSDDPESEFEAANDTIVDFRAGDNLDISGMFYNEADGDFFSHKVTFAELDTNGNGILTDADAGLSIARETYNGSTQFSLTIDFGQVSASIQEPGFVPSGSVTLFGVTTLQASDFG